MPSRQRGKFLLGADARAGYHRPVGSEDRAKPDAAGNRAERRAAAKAAPDTTQETP